MAKKLNSMPDYTARPQLHPHDMRGAYGFTTSTGMERCVYYDMLLTGDKIKFNSNLMARLNPMFVPSVGEIDLHLDYFFVPLSVIYTPATSMFYQTDDLLSSVFAKEIMVKDRFPVYDIDSALDNIQHDTAAGVNDTQVKSVGGVDVPYSTRAFDCIGKSALRLLDDFRYNHISLFDYIEDANPHTTPWFLAAYQAIHELYFRNDDREPKDYHYNLDRYFQTNQFHSKSLLRLNYVSAYRDYFNSVKVSPIGSSVSMLSGTASWDLLSKVNSYLFDGGNYGRSLVDGTTDVESEDSASVSIGSNFTDPYYQVNAANIRQLFMVDKMLRITGRANKDYESQFLAHFGIKIPHDDLHNITHIGHDMVSLSPQPVISSADTYNGDSGSALGEVGGQGYVKVSFDKEFKFKAPFHGVFMVIFHAQPKFRYYGGIDKLHDLSDPMKFPQPEYDKKGMQPLFGYEVIRRGTSLSTTRLGWQFNYEHFKRKYDRVSLVFANANSQYGVNQYAPWFMSRLPYRIPFTESNITGADDSVDASLRNFTGLLSTPRDLDTIMQVTYSTTWIQDLMFNQAYELFVTDPLICDYLLEGTKLNFMSEYGEPEID